MLATATEEDVLPASNLASLGGSSCGFPAEALDTCPLFVVVFADDDVAFDEVLRLRFLRGHGNGNGDASKAELVPPLPNGDRFDMDECVAAGLSEVHRLRFFGPFSSNEYVEFPGVSSAPAIALAACECLMVLAGTGGDKDLWRPGSLAARASMLNETCQPAPL